MNLNLKGKHAIVCGSTQGIGKAIALQLANQGASITLLARNEEKLKNVLHELPPHPNHGYLIADFSDFNQVERVITEWATTNTAHILINNTGGPKGGPLIDATPEELSAAFSQHVICNQILAKVLVPKMKKSNYGRIINIISTSVKQPINNLGVSNTIRGAVANWSKTLANELGKFNITVNNILPGFTNTNRLTAIASNKVEKGLAKSNEEAFENMTNAVPLGRIGEPSELANVVGFIVSPAASYVNGINIPVDGGRTKSL